MTKSVKVWESSVKTYHYCWVRFVWSWLRENTVRTMCPGLCVLEFKYSAAPTRRTTVTAVGTGQPNHCLHQAYWFYFLNPFISSVMCWWTWSLLFEDFDWRLSLIPQSYFFSQFGLHHDYPVFSLSVLCVLSFISSWRLCCCSVMLIPEYLFCCK